MIVVLGWEKESLETRVSEKEGKKESGMNRSGHDLEETTVIESWAMEKDEKKEHWSGGKETKKVHRQAVPREDSKE
jgi:hypothetical protein